MSEKAYYIRVLLNILPVIKYWPIDLLQKLFANKKIWW